MWRCARGGFRPVESEFAVNKLHMLSVRSEKLNQTNRFGIRGMRDRIQNLGGKFVVESLGGKGTKISSIVPSAKIKDVE